ncbi:MAG: DUF1801 domain-containing protein [Bacteroidales bacterium]
MNKQVTEYISKAPNGHREILEEARAMVHAQIKDVKEFYKWRRIVFFKDKELLYLRDASKYVAVGFFDSSKLKDPKNLLEASGEEMSHMKIKRLSDLDKPQLKEWIDVLGK